MKPVPHIQQRQQDQYVFPYHHISHIDDRGQGHRIRCLGWGFEYLLYNKRIVELICSLKPNSVLDVGCGDGYLLGQIPNDVAKKVGVDINLRALGFASAFFPHVDYRASDVADIEETFDVVCAIEVIEHIPDDEVSGFLKLISERVKPGGHILISVPTTNEPLNSKHFRHYDMPLLTSQIEFLATNFTLAHIEYYYRKTFVERVYQKLTKNIFVYGEIPVLRRLVWPYVARNATKATDKDGLHLIAILKMTKAD